MTRRRSLRIAQIDARSSMPAPHSCAERLPAELVTEMLKYLDQDDLWRAAAVSRTFYSSAWHAGLYIHRSARSAADLAALRVIVHHVLRHGLRLSLWFAAFFSVQSRSRAEISMALEVLSMVADALPLLVGLSLHVDEYFAPLIDDILRHRAPLLEELELSRFAGQIAEKERSAYIVPTALFSGSAPRLRRLTLCNVSLGSDPVPAFSSVNDCTLEYEYLFPDTDFSRHFPRIHSLHLVFAPTSMKVSPQSPCFRFDGISLRKLVLEDWQDASLVPSIDRSIKLCDIPNIEYGEISVVWTQPIWQQKTDETLSIRLRIPIPHCPDMSIAIVPEHRDWRRTCVLRECMQTEPCPIRDIPGIGNRLTYLRMDNVCLVCFLQCDGLALDALRDLQIDFEERETRATMIWPPDWIHALDAWEKTEVSWEECDRSAPAFRGKSYGHVHCRSLEKLTLFARDSPTCVQSQEVAFLGRALSQIPRPDKERATLALIGITFKNPVARALLDQTFSCVRRDKHCSLNSPADKNEGLWDEDV